MGRWDAVVGRGRDLSAMRVGVGIGHVWGHVAVVLIVMRARPAPLLVHVGVVCVRRSHRVEMVGVGVVCRGRLARDCGAIG